MGSQIMQGFARGSFFGDFLDEKRGSIWGYFLIEPLLEPSAGRRSAESSLRLALNSTVRFKAQTRALRLVGDPQWSPLCSGNLRIRGRIAHCPAWQPSVEPAWIGEG